VKVSNANSQVGGFTEGGFRSVSLGPLDTHINAQGQYIINFTTAVSIKAGVNMLKLYMPVWYESPYYGTFRYFLDSRPACRNLGVPEYTDIQCQFEEEVNVMVIWNYSPIEVQAGGIVTISIDAFRNTYTSGPKPGFTLYNFVLADDQSEYILVEKSEPQTLRLSDGIIDLPEDVTFLNRLDGSTQIGDNTTVLQFWFYWNIPVDKNCIFRINFPEDMPPTEGITLGWDSSGMFGNAPRILSINTTARYVEVEGCHDYEFWVNNPHYIVL
jgi:hypothetical protein